MDSFDLLGSASNLTATIGDSPSPAPTLSWVNVAIASSFILVNGTEKKHKCLIRT